MSTRAEHLELLKEKGKFTIDCNLNIFSHEEIQLLEKFGHWFSALSEGVLQPITKEQRAFVEVASGKSEPVSIEEKAWFKYLGRKKVEEKYGSKLGVQYFPEEDTFYSREMVKKNRSTVFKVIGETHRR